MYKYYRDYCWKAGVPYGIGGQESCPQDDAYKIVMDPYRKRISLERYRGGNFYDVIYDSVWLDFRHLRPENQMQWQREMISETTHTTTNLIRNQDDRVILKEVVLFEEDLCRECRVSTPQGIPISVHRMSYLLLDDPFDGVVLFDMNGHRVMRKSYSFDANERTFTELLKEEWDFSRA